jgi:hypothetical protein
MHGPYKAKKKKKILYRYLKCIQSIENRTIRICWTGHHMSFMDFAVFPSGLWPKCWDAHEVRLHWYYDGNI